jgi:hypothetical protein
MFGDPSLVDVSLQSRAVTFENPSGAPGSGGASAAGRKGSPSRTVDAGERVVLADLEGPATIRHVWCTVPPASPTRMRAYVLEVFYDGATEPSVSTPLLDFFGVACGRPTPYASYLTTAQEGRGFNAFFPMPFQHSARVEFVNGSERPTTLYYQIDYTLQPTFSTDAAYLHVSFRRENPTTLGRDFTIADGFVGAGRFLGCAIGIRPIDGGRWYGEGEVKIYLDGDSDMPTICGTGLEDYVGSAWGMGSHAAPFAGVPLDIRSRDSSTPGMPDFVGLYRWHVADPIVFNDSLRVTIQQIGMHLFLEGEEEERDSYLQSNPLAGHGWFPPRAGVLGMGLFERVDDYSAAAFVYCKQVQPVATVDVVDATADLARHPYERPDSLEGIPG